MLTMRFQFADELIASLRSKGPRVVAVIATRIETLMEQLASYIVSTKLSGQVLGRVSGKLAESVHVIPTQFAGTKFIFGVEAAGGDAFYGKIYEEGLPFPWAITAVNARALQFVRDEHMAYAKWVVHPLVEPKPFMSTALEEYRAYIGREIIAAANEATGRK